MPHNMVLSAVATLRQLRHLLGVPKSLRPLLVNRPRNSTEKPNPTDAPTTPTATELPAANFATYMAASRPTHPARLIGLHSSPASSTSKPAQEAYWKRFICG